MSSRRPDGSTRDIPRSTFSRRRLLAAGGVVAAGSLAGCLNRIASSVTNTGASPAAVFAGTARSDDDTAIALEMARGGPHVARLTPTLAGRVELEGWVTSAALMAQNHNSSRSNRPRLSSTRSSDGDSDGDGVSDGDEDDELLAYLDGKPIVGERFTVCLPDAEVPGGNGSIREAVTPERLIAYLTDGDGGDLLSKAESKSRAVEGGGDCDDDDTGVYPGAVCGTTPHFVAEVTGPTATGGGLEVIRVGDGSLVVTSLPEADRSATTCAAMADDDPCGPGVWARTTGGRELSEGSMTEGFFVGQVMVQPPECPRPFPALLYVSRGLSDGQLLYSGGWVIDDAALYENSGTVLTLAGSASVVGIECCFDYDSDGDGFGDVVKRSVSGARALRGARMDWGTVEELVESGVLSKSVGNDILVRKRPGRTKSDGAIELLHVAVDAPVLHLASAESASNEVKFKAGAELSGQVNLN